MTDRKGKNVGGRPAHQPTEADRRQVEMMAGFGLTEVEIASVIGITAPTLRVHYRVELDVGHVKANAKVASNLFRQATKDDPKAVTAAMFWLRCRAGWSEYAPPPAPKEAKPEPLGKKEAANLEAQSAESGTGWGELLN